MTAEEIAAIAVALLAGSELLSYLPDVKANGWVQLVIGALQGIANSQNNKKRRR